MQNFKSSEEGRLSSEQYLERWMPYAHKYQWFEKVGYKPHYWQGLFHTMDKTVDAEVPYPKLLRFRHLVAGRRGGKTYAAAMETLYYLLHPEFFHWDVHHKVSSRSLWAWALAKDHTLGFPSLHTFRQAVEQAGLIPGKDYKENRGDKFFEFSNGSRIDFKSGEDPERLRGAGLDILWIDEAAFLPNRNAFDRVYPALSDKLGILFTTTTPDGKNWMWHEFWSDEAFADPDIGRVEYTSIDCPYFPEEEWIRVKKRLHPMLFRKEYEARFDSMDGVELSGDWLHYYEKAELPRKDGKLDLRMFIGVDPAVSLSDKADQFSMALIGVSPHGDVYLLEQYTDRIPFPEQVEKIAEWQLRYRPQIIGIEAQAYQMALAQQTARLTTIPPIVPMFATGKKEIRILSMSPLFKIGKIKIRADHIDFIEQWVNYDTTKKNPEDDCLDAVEIALRAAGALLPELVALVDYDKPTATLQELVDKSVPSAKNRKEYGLFDDLFGGEW